MSSGKIELDLDRKTSPSLSPFTEASKSLRAPIDLAVEDRLIRGAPDE